MRIIEEGKLPEEEEFEVRCTNCRTKFAFLRGEAKFQGDQRDGDSLIVDCPLCKKKVWKSLRETGSSYYDR